MPVPPPSAYPPGTRLTVGSHDVEIERFIGEGGFAHVYTVRATPPVPGHDICCLKRVQVPNKAYLNLLRAEVDAMQRLIGASNIVQYFDSHAERMRGTAGAEGQYEVFLLMEFCSRGGLIDFMNQRLRDQLREHEILKIMYDITLGLAHMHYLVPPLLHRDLKIENVLISSDGTFKLCDFGSVSPVLRPPKTPQEFQILEDDINHQTTVQYRAPEMINITQGHPINEKSDIWALGIFLYKLCFYTTPFERPNQTLEQFQQLILTGAFVIPPRPAYSERLRNMIRVLLQTDPRSRPNVFHVMQEICQMRHVECPIKDIYTRPSLSQVPSLHQLQISPYPSQPAPAQPTQQQAVPQLPQTQQAQQHGPGQVPVPGVLLTSPLISPNSPELPPDDLESRFPTLEELDSIARKTKPTKPSSMPSMTSSGSGNVPSSVPSNASSNVPGSVTGSLPGSVSGSMPNNVSSNVPGNAPSHMAGNIQGNIPGSMPNSIPGVSSNMAGNMAGNTPGVPNAPKNGPSSTSDTGPSSMPNSAPTSAPNSTPNSVPAAHLPSVSGANSSVSLGSPLIAGASRSKSVSKESNQLHQILTGLNDKSSTVIMDSPDENISSVDFLRTLRPAERRPQRFYESDDDDSVDASPGFRQYNDRYETELYDGDDSRYDDDRYNDNRYSEDRYNESRFGEDRYGEEIYDEEGPYEYREPRRESRRSGEYSRPSGEYSRNSGECSRTSGEYSRTSGEYNHPFEYMPGPNTPIIVDHNQRKKFIHLHHKHPHVVGVAASVSNPANIVKPLLHRHRISDKKPSKPANPKPSLVSIEPSSAPKAKPPVKTSTKPSLKASVSGPPPASKPSVGGKMNSKLTSSKPSSSMPTSSKPSISKSTISKSTTTQLATAPTPAPASTKPANTSPKAQPTTPTATPATAVSNASAASAGPVSAKSLSRASPPNPLSKPRPKSAIYDTDFDWRSPSTYGELAFKPRNSIQQRVHSFLNSHDRQHPTIRTAKGYGRFTDSEVDSDTDDKLDFGDDLPVKSRSHSSGEIVPWTPPRSTKPRR